MKRADVTALVLPCQVAQRDGCGVERRFCQDQFAPVTLINFRPKPLAVRRQILCQAILEAPVPNHLRHTCWGAVMQDTCETPIHLKLSGRS